MKYAFYCHGGSQNHGCEAIVKTLSRLIKSKDSSNEITLYTFRKDEDEYAHFTDIDRIIEHRIDVPVKLDSLTIADKVKLALLRKISQKKADEYFYTLSCKHPTLNEHDAFISVGGDNYCYGDNHVVIAMNRVLKKLGKKTVLWGCSIGEENLTEDKIADLKSYDLIVTRETLTYELLISHGINKNTVLYPDPAFTLDVSKDMTEKFEVKANTVGINISTLIDSYADNSIAYDSVVKLVRYLLDETDMNVVLVPHVTRDKANDSEILGRIYDNFDSPRLTIVNWSYGASDYKSVISRCTVFVGARTHATIAAYSTCVPTLVIGYSVKSKGIARDLFGTDKGLVIPVWELDSEDSLTEEFKKFFKKKDAYKARLDEIMHEYKKRAFDSVNELTKI